MFNNVSTEHFQLLNDVPFTSKGHMKRIRQGMNSTSTSDTLDDFFDYNDPITPPNVTADRPHHILVKVSLNTDRVHMDATGAYVYSNNTKSYDIIFYNEDHNYIHVEQIPGLTASNYATAVQAGIDFYKSQKIILKSEEV